MGKKTVIRRIANYLPMSVQRAAMFDELQDAGKPVEITEYGEIVMGSDEVGGVIDNDAADGGKKSKLDEFAGTPKKTKRRAQTQATTSEAEDTEAPTVEDYLEDFANVPTAEGLDHKFAQASEHYKDDAAAMAQFTLARTERKKALEAPKTEATPPQPGGGKRLFQHTDEEKERLPSAALRLPFHSSNRTTNGRNN